MERKTDLNGIPQPFNQAEKDAATAAYIKADEAGKIEVLKQYPFLAGRDHAKYSTPAAVPPAPETK